MRSRPADDETEQYYPPHARMHKVNELDVTCMIQVNVGLTVNIHSSGSMALAYVYCGSRRGWPRGVHKVVLASDSSTLLERRPGTSCCVGIILLHPAAQI